MGIQANYMDSGKNSNKGKRKSASEGPQIRKLRRKLSQQWVKQDEIMTPSAIENQKKIIMTSLMRRSGQRIPLEDRNISLFDENKHPEPVHSKFVIDKIQQIHAGQFPPAVPTEAKKDSQDQESG